MRESSKTRATRSDGFYETFMRGAVLDIGCGDDLCVPHAVPFDKADGDANDITKYFALEMFDCVHSSHCLEHMLDPVKCLNDWWSLVKPGGFFVIIIPDEDLYEQGNWPSLFNFDHKHTFRLDGPSSWSPVSHNVQDLINALPGVATVSAKRVDAGYVHLRPVQSQASRKVATKLADRIRWLTDRPDKIDTLAGRLAVRLALAAGYPVDQTLGKALAQIEIIAQKRGPILADGKVDTHAKTLNCSLAPKPFNGAELGKN